MNEYRANVVIHIDETLDDEQIHDVEKELSFESGVLSTCINEDTRHLMVVDYDPRLTTSGLLLGNVQGRGFHAELIGF